MCVTESGNDPLYHEHSSTTNKFGTTIIAQYVCSSIISYKHISTLLEMSGVPSAAELSGLTSGTVGVCVCVYVCVCMCVCVGELFGLRVRACLCVGVCV
jgi:hypothetical protein